VASSPTENLAVAPSSGPIAAAAGGASNRVIHAGDGTAIGGDQINNANPGPVENMAMASGADQVAANEAGGPAGNKVIHAGEGTSIGGNQNNYAAPAKHCLLGGERIIGDRDFMCPDCKRSPLCDKHYDVTLLLCSRCLLEQTVACSLCNERLPAEQMFTCTKCLMVVGKDHLGPYPDLCTKCGDRFGGIVEAMEMDSVGIDATGHVVIGEDVELINGVLQTKAGHPVSTLKKQTWYARVRQWHEVRPSLVRRETQAMHRFYPDFVEGKTSRGEFTWRGSVATWTGNAYDILLRYPASFPSLPPRAFVLNPQIQESRHIYKDGHLCLMHKDDKAWNPRTTGATMVSWASLWLHCYEVWMATGNWPRPEADEIVISPDYQT
jgi:hypothetical protein